MPFKKSTATVLIAIVGPGLCAGAVCAGVGFWWGPRPPPRGGRGGGRGGAGLSVFTAADLNKDGFVTRDELKAAFARWLSDGDVGRTGSLTQEQLAAAL